MTSPRRVSTGSTDAGGVSTGTARDWAHDRRLAFTRVLEQIPADRLHGKVAATLVVTLDADTLKHQLKAAHLDTGDPLSAGEGRRRVEAFIAGDE